MTDNTVDEKMVMRHPDSSKMGVSISRMRYNSVRQVILDVVAEYGEVTFRDLFDAVIARLSGKFEGAIGWYVTTVKLDLEARGEIERVPGQEHPHRLRLTTKMN